MPTTRTLALAAGALATGALAVAPSAQAATVDLAPKGGSTTLKLDAGAAKALKSLGVKVSLTGKAKSGSSGIAFPITGGSYNPETAAGTYKHTGGLRFSAGKIKLGVSDFNVTVAKTPGVSVKVNGGSRVNLLRPVLGKAKITRSGIGTTVTNVPVHLTAVGASALNKTFHVKAFKSKLKLGTVVIKAVPGEIAFAGGQTDLALDAGAAAALTSLGVTPGLVGPAKANADGTFGFPILGGKVDATSLAGTIPHSGGISLTAGATVVQLTDFTIDTTAKTLSAKVNGAGPVAILDLDLSSPKVGISGRNVTVGNVPAKLTQGAADALNGAFKVTAFTKGLLLGVATVRGQAV